MRYIKQFKHMTLNISESYLDTVRVDSHGKNIVWEDVSGLYVSVDNITDATYIGLWNSDGKIGSLSLAGERYYNNRIYRKVDYIEIDSRYRGNGYGTLLYKIGLKYLREDIDGIYSYLPNRSNKSQVPRIYKRFKSWVDGGDYEYIDRSLNENIRILENLSNDSGEIINRFELDGYKESRMVDKSFHSIKYSKRINENKYGKNIQSELDNILDKINDNGFDSLSSKEKNFIKSFNKGTEKESYREFTKKEYEDGIFKFELDNIKDVGNGEREFHGTLTIDNIRFNGYILYKSTIGVSSPHFDDGNGLTIWDHVEDFEYYLDDFIDYIISDNE